MSSQRARRNSKLRVGQLESKASESASDAHGESVGTKLVAWTFCGVGLGILPVVLNFLTPFFTNSAFSFTKPLADGELLIAATAIAGGAIGELWQVNIVRTRQIRAANVAGGFGILFCVTCASCYAFLKQTKNVAESGINTLPILRPGSVAVVPQTYGEIRPAISSLILFTLALAAAATCVKVAAEARR